MNTTSGNLPSLKRGVPQGQGASPGVCATCCLLPDAPTLLRARGRLCKSTGRKWSRVPLVSRSRAIDHDRTGHRLGITGVEGLTHVKSVEAQSPPIDAM
ncbi:hypothetical protein TNCV_4038841 [Trichonephila clavipes]|nr:hypothetical protein TNCV_4038841 [Trichonephila clavipes]